MLDDILGFAALHLVDNGRLSLWMPTANDEEVELDIPTHYCLEIVSVCVQPFNKCRFQLLKCRGIAHRSWIHRVKEAPHISKIAK